MAGNQGKTNRDKASREFLRLLDDTGWLVLGEYVNSETPLDVICPAGHETSVTRRYFVNTCRICRPERATRGFEFHQPAPRRHQVYNHQRF